MLADLQVNSWIHRVVCGGEVVAECLTCLTPGGKVWVWDVAESLFCVLGQDTVPLFTQDYKGVKVNCQESWQDVAGRGGGGDGPM